jgi:formate dehydrogenase maturation protein FdhE
LEFYPAELFFNKVEADLNPEKTIENNIQTLANFADDLSKFLQKHRSLSLFKKLPIRDESASVAQRLSDGHYLMTPCGIELLKTDCNAIAIELSDILKKHLVDRTEEVNLIIEYLLKEKINSQEIITLTLKNEGNQIQKLIRELNLPEDLFTFYLIYLARPFREQAANYFFEKIEKLNWNFGYCPICGHWPALGHIYTDGGSRTLWCLCCGTKWNFKRTQCVFCLNENHELLDIIMMQNEEAYRIQGCNNCKRYLKDVRSSTEVKNFNFDKIYLATLPLDIIGSNEGFIQESMLTVRYENTDGNELLLYRQKASKAKTIKVS